MAQRHGPARVSSQETLEPEDRIVPFGRHQRRRFGDVGDNDLLGLRGWCDQKNDDGRFNDLIDLIDLVLERRHG